MRGLLACGSGFRTRLGRRFRAKRDRIQETRIIAANQPAHAIDNAVEDRLDQLQLDFREIAEYMAGDGRFVAGMPDADPHARMVRAEMRMDGPQAVMAGMAATDRDPGATRRKDELVMG